MRGGLLLIVAVMLAAIGGTAGCGATATHSTAGAMSPAALTAAGAAPAPCATAITPHAYGRVIWIWMENHSFSNINGIKTRSPSRTSIAARCGLAANYH